MTVQEVNLLMDTDHLWDICTHCEFGQVVLHWGDNKCLYEKCGKTYHVKEYTAEKVINMLIAKKQKSKPKPKVWVNKKPILQKLYDRYILVDQGGEWKDA